MPAARPAGFARRSFGAYELLAPLAVGGTAEVYLARQVGHGGVDRLMVVKQLLPEIADDPEFRKMFVDEARLGGKLHHPNIVYTYETGEAEGRAFIALEYLAGLTLGQLAARARERVPGGLPIELAVAIIRDACHGLHHAHEARTSDGKPLRIVHRDVSPQNIIVTFGGEVKVVDLGIAHAAVREARTRTGLIKGKFAYMSPEQCMGKPVDRRTDVFAAAVVLYELVTGTRLFKRKSTYETYQAILRPQIVPPSSANRAVDAELERTILRALASDPDARHPTAEALAGELDAWLRRRGFGATGPAAAGFYASYFARELAEHHARLAALAEGRGAAAPAVSWDPEDDPEPQREGSGRTAGAAPPSAPLTSGPDERTVVGASPGARARGSSWKPLLLFAALFVATVAIALAVSLLR